VSTIAPQDTSFCIASKLSSGRCFVMFVAITEINVMVSWQ